MDESVDYWRDDSLGGIDLLRAAFHGHSFAPHAHSEYVLCVYEAGAQTFLADGVRHVVLPGSTLLLPPGTEHTGEAFDRSGFAYRAFYPSAALVEKLTDGAVKPGHRTVWTSSSREVFSRVLSAHKTFEAGSSVLEKEGALALALQLPFADEHQHGSSPGPHAWKLRAAREYVEAHYTDQALSIHTLADEVSLSAAHLMREFRGAYGLHIHAYVTQLRLERARCLMLDGEAPAFVAGLVGFVDQSHLIRRFKQFFGTTPGRYLRESARRRQ